jgi:GNAT superfamily N-acetyltransferase
MNPLVIRQCTVADIQNAPNVEALMKEYASESHSAELPPPNVQWGHYQALENAGSYHVIGAFINDVLVGFVGILNNKLPHHGATLAITESFFVSKEHRKQGAGLKLLHAAEQYASDIGSPCIMVNTPHGGSLERVMPRMGYRQSHSTFVRSVS